MHVVPELQGNKTVEGSLTLYSMTPEERMEELNKAVEEMVEVKNDENRAKATVAETNGALVVEGFSRQC